MVMKKKIKEEVRTMRSQWWYYKGSDIIGEGREQKGWVNYRTESKEEVER